MIITHQQKQGKTVKLKKKQTVIKTGIKNLNKPKQFKIMSVIIFTLNPQIFD